MSKRRGAASGVRAAKAPVSANSVGLGCLAALGVLWMLSFLLSAAALASTAYVRWKTLELRQTVLPVSCTPDPANDGAVIHIDCPIRPKTAFTTPPEFAANVPKVDGVFLEIHVEMFQARGRGAGLLRGGAGEWYDHLVDDTIDYFPYIGGSGRRFATEVYAGGFRIDNSDVMTSFHGKKLIPLKEDGKYEPSIERPPLKINSRNTRVFANSLYTGDPYNPVIGDVRITFYGSSATHVSAIGVQEPAMKLLQLIGAGEHYIKGFPDVFAADDVRIHRLIAQEGDFTASELVTQYEQQNNAFNSFYWFSLVNFAVTTALLVIFLLRKIRQGAEAASRTSPLDMGVAGICITAGCLLMTASVPNLVGYYVKGTMQFVLGLACMVCGVWVDVQSQNGRSLFARRPYKLLPRHESPPKSNEVALLPPKHHRKKQQDQTAYVPL